MKPREPTAANDIERVSFFFCLLQMMALRRQPCGGCQVSFASCCVVNRLSRGGPHVNCSRQRVIRDQVNRRVTPPHVETKVRNWITGLWRRDQPVRLNWRRKTAAERGSQRDRAVGRVFQQMMCFQHTVVANPRGWRRSCLELSRARSHRSQVSFAPRAVGMGQF